MNTLLSSLFEGKREQDHILIWTMPGKISHWYRDVKEIDPQKWPGENVYFGVGTSATDRGANLRAKAEEVTGIGGFWLDVDIAGPAHKKGSLPQDAMTAMTLVKGAFPALQQSYVVSSGHGLQVYYLLDEFLHITSENRQSIEKTLLAFSTRWRTYCKSHGFDADSVHDLPRVMRLPGSINVKIADDPSPVLELQGNPHLRYKFNQLRDAATVDSRPTKMPEKQQQPQNAPNVSPGQLPIEKWEALKLADARIERTWNYDRPELADQSPSSFDMALAQFAIRAGWSDAEAIALCIACRKYHGKEIKRAHYFQMLATKVRKEIEQSKAVDLHEDETKEGAMSRLSQEFGLDIKTLIRYDSDPAAYNLHMTDGRKIGIGQIESLTTQKKFRDRLADTIGTLISRCKEPVWDDRVRTLLAHVEHDSAGSESTDAGQITEWLHAYLHQASLHENRSDGLTTGQPWKEEGYVYITASGMRQWLSVRMGDRTTSRQLCLMLRSVGCEPCILAAKSEDGKSTRSAWRVSQKIYMPETEDEEK